MKPYAWGRSPSVASGAGAAVPVGGRERRPRLMSGVAVVLGFAAASCGSDTPSSATVTDVSTPQAVSSQPETTTSTRPETTVVASADGTLVYGRDVSGHAADIYISAAGGTGETQLTTDPGFDACGTFTPDGAGVAFCSNRSGSLEIWMMNRDGTNQHQVTKIGGTSVFPEVSPDGTKIAFSGSPDANSPEGETDIWLINVDGSGLTQLTTAAGADAYATWSPDGTQLAWLSGRSGATEIWAMDADGANPHALTTDATSKDQLPDWSPDGAKIAYESAGVCDPGKICPGHIFVMNADGTSPLQITSGTGDDFGPAWSPDAKRVAFVRTDGDSQYIYVVNANGTDEQTLFSDGKYRVPDWIAGGS